MKLPPGNRHIHRLSCNAKRPLSFTRHCVGRMAETGPARDPVQTLEFPQNGLSDALPNPDSSARNTSVLTLDCGGPQIFDPICAAKYFGGNSRRRCQRYQLQTRYRPTV
jgi:hypothetical protein